MMNKKTFKKTLLCGVGSALLSFMSMGYANQIMNFSVELDSNKFFVEGVVDDKVLTIDDLKPIGSNEPLKVARYMQLNIVKSDLSKIEEYFIEPSGERVIVFDTKSDINRDCVGYYLTYHLKSDKYPTVKSIIRDSRGDFVKTLDDKRCKTPNLNERDGVVQTKDGVVAGFFWNRPALSIKSQVGFNSSFQKEGLYFLPDLVSSYVIKPDMTALYNLRNIYPKNSASLAAFTGLNFVADINNPGLYYFAMQLPEDNILFTSVKRVH